MRSSKLQRCLRGEGEGEQMTSRRASGNWAWTQSGIDRRGSKVKVGVAGYTVREESLRIAWKN